MLASGLNKSSFVLCRNRRFCLAFVWCFSVSVGIMISYLYRETTLPLMRGIVKCNISLPGFAVILLFPLLVSAIAAVCNLPNIIYLPVVLDGVSLGYLMYASILSFGDSGWMVLVLFSFSSLLTRIPRLWLFLSVLLDRTSLLGRFVFFFLYSVLVCLLDCFVVPVISGKLMF